MPRRKCRKCGAKEGGDVRLQRCSKCKEAKGTDSAHYCSYECLEADWPEHKKVHEDQERQAATLTGRGHFDAAAWRDAAVRVESDHARLLYRAIQHIEAGDPKQAAIAAKEAIALEPRKPDAYRLLAYAYRFASDPRETRVLLDLMDRLEPDTLDWATIAIAAWCLSGSSGCHFKRYHPCGKWFCSKRCCVGLPAWLRDPAEAKQMAHQIAAHMPDASFPREMLAAALYWLGEWEAAGGAWIQAARLCTPGEIADSPERKPKLLQGARAAFARARETCE